MIKLLMFSGSGNLAKEQIIYEEPYEAKCQEKMTQTSIVTLKLKIKNQMKNIKEWCWVVL